MAEQVNLVTKDGSGQPLPFWQKQFISFSYGGKYIEEFDLVVAFSSDRLEKQMYSPFKDITSSSDIMDGQAFWGSFFKEEKLKFTLATDGMTSESYDNFKKWFIPGIYRELILSEFPNRLTLARIATPPQISLMPFEDKRTVKIGGITYDFSTSIYKGEIEVEFVMDEPHWCARNSLLEIPPLEAAYNDLKMKDVVKIIHEDKVPVKEMFELQNQEDVVFLGDKKAIIGGEKVTITIDGEDKLKITPKLEHNYTHSSSDKGSLFLYNCGTTPAHSELSFTVTPIFKDNLVVFNKINTEDNNFTRAQFQIGETIFSFSLPGFLISYNSAISMILNIQNGDSILDFRREARDNLYHYYARAWLIAAIDAIREKRENDAFEEEDKTLLIEYMKNFIVPINGDSAREIQLKFNSKTGVTSLRTQVEVVNEISYSSEKKEFEYSTSSLIVLEENAGDMVKSKYLQIEGGCKFSKGSSDELIIQPSDCLSIKSDFKFTKLSIDYKYTYL